MIEFDFAAMDGAGLLFSTAKDFLEKLDGIALDGPAEARYLRGNAYLSGLSALFAAVKTKKTALKAAKDLSTAFSAALTAAIAGGIAPPFVDFVHALSQKGVKVVISTRADVDAVKPSFEQVLCDSVTLFHEESPCYGSVQWDSWRRICVMNGMSRKSAVAIAGSGHSVKAALMAGIGAVAVVNERVAYQDFTGADEVVDELSGEATKKVLSVLRAE